MEINHKCLGDASLLNSAFSRISKLLASVSHPCPISQETMHKWEKSLKESSVVCRQAAAFNRCISKIQDEVQDSLRHLFGDLGKGKSSQRTEKSSLLSEKPVFQQNITFVLGKSMQHMADTIFVLGANMRLLQWDSYWNNSSQESSQIPGAHLGTVPFTSQPYFPIQSLQRLMSVPQPSSGSGSG